jgi:hypothetical protein
VARVYWGEFTSIAGVVHRVEIWDAPSGSAVGGTELNLVNEGYQIERQGEGDLLFENRVKKSKATAYFAINNNTDASYFENMAIDLEGSHAMIIYKNNSVVWIGRVLGDLFQWQRSAVEGNRIYEITSVDTLSLLDNYKIKQAWFTSGKITLLHLITSILKVTELDAYWGAISRSGYFVADALLTYETTSGTNYRLPRFRINAASLIENYDPTNTIIRQSDDDDEDNISCLEALNKVLGSFAAYIILENGMFFIHQYSAYISAIIYDIYSTSETLTQTNASITHEHTIENSQRPFFEAFPTHSYQPPIKQIKLTTYKAVSKKVAKSWRPPYNNSHLSLGPVTMSQGKSVKFDFYINFVHNYRDIFVLKYKAWAVERSTGNTYTWSGTAWVLTATINYTDIKIDIPAFNAAAAQSTTYRGSYSVPDNALIAGFDFYFDMYLLRNIMTPGSYGMVDEPFTGSVNCYQEISENLKTYNNISNPKASKVVELDSYFYDGMGADGMGTIQVYNGSAWSNSDQWVAPGSGTGSFEDILVKQIIGYYAKAVKSINCNVRDNGLYNGLKTLYFDSSAWVSNGYTYGASSETYDGEWLKLFVDYEAVEGGDLIYDNNPKGQTEFRVRQLESDIQTTNGVESAMSKNLSSNLFYDKGNTNPSLDSFYSVNIFYNPTTYLSEFQLQELGLYVTKTTGTHSVVLTDRNIICTTSDGDVVLNLPSAETCKGITFFFKKIGTNHKVIINATAIDRQNHFDINADMGCVEIESDGVEFWIKSKHP